MPHRGNAEVPVHPGMIPSNPLLWNPAIYLQPQQPRDENGHPLVDTTRQNVETPIQRPDLMIMLDRMEPVRGNR